MKKLTYAIALSSLLLAGCSQDEGIMESKGELVTMNYNLSLGNTSQSRGEGEQQITSIRVNKLMCAVYEIKKGEDDSTETYEWKYTQSVYDNDYSDGIKFSYSPMLLNNIDYKIVFFACYETSGESPNTYFMFDANKTLQSIKADISNTTEAFKNNAYKDAFVGCDEVRKGTSKNEGKITLKRPFPQVNVLTSKQDYDDAASIDKVPTSCSITFSKILDTYNALNNSWSNEITYNLTSIVNAENKVTNINGIDYYFLCNKYLFGSTVANITCQISIKSGEDEIYNSGEIANFPLGSNQSTNFINEKLLTGGGITYEIILEEDFIETNYNLNGNN